MQDILFALTEEAQLQIRLAAAKNEQAILRLDKAAASKSAALVPDRESIGNRILSDSLISIGNFIGSSSNSPQLKQLSEQTALLPEIRQNTRGRSVDFPL